jgi:hypothetical protein
MFIGDEKIMQLPITSSLRGKSELHIITGCATGEDVSLGFTRRSIRILLEKGAKSPLPWCTTGQNRWMCAPVLE